ncbi:MAG: hypothetical protein K2X27_03140 [Candidatus Obscuribacterales bacterium]|nr:hypothetical protein [Candidatus Obscuribacterales bacterium]
MTQFLTSGLKTLLLALLSALLLLSGVARAEEAEPSSPVRASIADERINVYLGTPRVNGYGIGDSIPITIVFELLPLDRNTKRPSNPLPNSRQLEMPQINVSGLKMQIQSAEPLDVEMLTPAAQVTQYEQHGRQYLKIVFYVWTFVTTQKTQVEVKADFMYATMQLEDGQPDWRKATTPSINIGIRRTSTDNQVTILEGDIKEKASPQIPATLPFLVGAPLLMLPLFLALAFAGYARFMQPRKLSANEESWLLLDPVLTEASRSGFTLAHYKQIFYTLRRRFAVLAFDGDELTQALRKHKDLAGVDFAVVELVFGMESIFYARGNSASEEQSKAFIEGIKLILPRH